MKTCLTIRLPSETPAAEVDRDRRLETVEARVEHLETALAGLEDALDGHQILDERTSASCADLQQGLAGDALSGALVAKD